MSATNNKRSLYISPTKDADIIEYIKPLLVRYDFSSVIRELVRDGIRFRSAPQIPQSNYVAQSHTSPLVNIELKRKEISDDDLEDKLDSF